MRYFKLSFQVLLFALLALPNLVHAQFFNGPTTVCANSAEIYFLNGFQNGVDYKVSYTNGNGPLIINGGFTSSIPVTWFDPQGCDRTSGSATGTITATPTSGTGGTASITVTIKGLGAPGAVSGPTSIGCGVTSFVVSVPPGFNATSHTWSGLPAGWSLSCNNANCSSATVHIPANDCNNYDLNINAASTRSDCAGLSCPSLTPLHLIRIVVPTPVFRYTCPLVCSQDEQFTFSLSNFSDYVSVVWNTSGPITPVSENGGATFTVSATANSGDGTVTCTVYSACCSKTFTVTKLHIGPPVLTYLDFSENGCPEFRVETDLSSHCVDRYTWKWYKEPFMGYYDTKTTTANSTKLILAGGPATYRIAVSATNRCGTGAEVIGRFFVRDCRNGGHVGSDATGRSEDADGVETVFEEGFANEEVSEPEIAPNPTQGSFTVKLPANFYKNSLYSVKIFDGIGKCLYTKDNIADTMLEINDWKHEPGVYFVQIKGNGTDKVVTKKLVVQ